MTYEEYKRKKKQQEKAPEALTPYQKYRAEKGVSTEPTNNNTAASMKSGPVLAPAEAATFQRAQNNFSPVAKMVDDANQATQQELTYRQKYAGMDQTRLREAKSKLTPDSKEYVWLNSYITETMRPEDYARELEETDRQLQQAQSQLHQIYGAGGADYFTPEEISQAQQLQDTIRTLTHQKWDLEQQSKYRYLSEAENYAELSKPATTEQKSGYIDALIRNASYHYDLINDLLPRSDLSGKAREDGNFVMAGIWDMQEDNLGYLTANETANYNYLYNTQGEDSAEEYLAYLKNTLSSRAEQYTLAEWQKLAKQLPVQTSIASVPMSLWGGVGMLDALGQKVVQDVSGEYSGPINYSSAAMLPAKAASTIRGTVAQDLADEHGTIQLDEEKHPVLSRVLNGKSWGDVYQLGMSMVDSAAVAALNPVLGTAGTVLLGGNAATQTMLDAVANGASDEQALSMGILSGAFETIFEKFELDHLLGADTNIVKAIINQALSEAVGEGATSISNAVADALVLGENSNWQKNIDRYMQENPGMTEAEARKQAFIDAAIQVGWDSVGGLFSGGIMGGGASVAQNVSSHTQQPQSAPQSGVDPQAENGQTTQETAAEPAPGSLEWVQELNELGAGKKTTTPEKPRISMADFANQESPVWRNVAYNDDATKASIMQDTHDAMVAEGSVVKVSDEVAENVDQAYPDLRSMKKKERAPILKSAMTRLKTDLRQFLNGFKNQSFEFDVNGQVLDATLYSTGINEVMEKVTKEKANMLYSTEAIFRNARYLYSTPDYDGNPNVYRWNYFYTPVQIGEATVGVRIAVRDMVKGTDGATPESQIYNWGIKKDASLDGGSHDPKAASSDVSSDASNNSISETPPVVNTDSTQPTSPESVGAAPAGFDPNSHLQYQYGTLPEGENAVRPDDLPVSTDGKNRVSQTAVTVKGAQVTSDEFSDLLTKDVTEKNGMTYIPITNDATVQKAIAHIKAEGWENAKAKWHADVQNGKTGADMAAVGALLLNNAAKAGDKSAWLDILHDYQILGTNTAQGLQALRILKKLSPSDKLYMAKRSVKQMVEDMKLDTDVTIDPELETEYNEAETDAQRDEVLVKIQKDVARQLPTTFMEKFTALRYVNMLGNLRTQGRNIVGNLTMMGTRAIHNAIATSIETVANKVSGGKIQRTRSVTVSKEQKAAAAKDFDSLQEQILGGGKYNDNMTATSFARGVQEQKKIFKFKPLEGYRKVTNWAMEQGDIIFARDAYARALAGYLKANGITETDFSKVDPGVMDDARLFAAKEAQEATFRDTNWLSGWVSKVGRRKDTPAGVKILSEGVMPFRKTPANVLVRAEEYSPLAIVNSAVMSVQKLAGNTSLVNKHGLLGKFARAGQEITGTQVINSWAKTLTGTGLFGIGMLLQGLGLLSAGPDEDDKEDAFEDLNGWQDYALTLPDGTNLTIDCFSPSAIPVLMGAQLMKLIRENGLQLKDFETALTSIADPLVEMSMLQGVNDSLENIQYADSNVGQLVINAGLSYLTQGLTNTLAGQLERSFEDSRMQTYVDKDSDLPALLQRFLGKASAKTPGWDYNQIPYINAWGEEEETPSTGVNLVYNLLSPSYFDKGKDDDLTRELTRLNDAQSDVNVYPSVPDKTVTINKQDYNLSADEYVSLAKLQGQTQKRLVEDLIGNSAYGVLSDDDKAQAIRYAYDYAQQSARGDVIKGHPGITKKWMKELKGDIAEGILRHITVDGKYAALSVSDAAYIDDLLDGLTAEKGRSNVRPIQQIEAIADSKLSEADQKKVLEETLNESAYDKFMAVLKLGMDTDDYAASYRLYLDAEGGSGKKARIIKSFQNELDVTYSVAVKLYNIYAGKK